MSRLRALLVVVLLVLAPVDNARAEWIQNGVPLVTSAAPSYPNAIVADGAGGAIVFVTDSRNGTDDLFAQRVDGFGVPQWTANGVIVSVAAFDQGSATACPDGSGGAIVAWADARSGVHDIYVQRINAAGTALWTANGVALCTATDTQVAPYLVSDGAGGAVVVWQDLRSGTGWDLYARRINSAGTPQWAANGVAVCVVAPSNQTSARLVEDGSGGVIITWGDFRAGNSDIYAQRLNASGVAQWAANGVPVCVAANNQGGPEIVTDGAAGAIVAWEDARSGSDDIYAQRVRFGGTMSWIANGIPVCTAPDIQGNLSIVADGAGGAVMAWQDVRSVVDVDIYAQRVSGSGAVLWDYDGVVLAASANVESPPALVPDGAGGAIATWSIGVSNSDSYAQAVNAAGVARWQANGVPVAATTRSQFSPIPAQDGAGGAIIAFADDRTGLNHVFAQRVETRYGFWGRPEPTVDSAEDNPGDQGGKVILRWVASQRDRFDSPAISHYSVWRSTDFVTAAAAAAGVGVDTRVVKNPLEVTEDFAGRAVWERATASGPEYWEWIVNQDAFYLPSYSYTAPTRQDSVAGEPAIHYFKVIAHEYDYPQTRAWESGTVSTYSVDNLAPAAPLFLTAQRVGSDVNLRWNRAAAPDLRDYAVYRATSSGVSPVPVNFLAGAEDTLLVDTNAPLTALYYIVTAIDVHENESTPSNEASVSTPTGVGNTPPISALTVGPNHPNPFTGTTSLALGLPGASDVAIEVFDVAGRRVREQTLARQPAGWRTLAYDGRDDQGRPLPSGVYFYRVRTAAETVTRKIVITR
jgi:hypothetical protein